MVKGMELMYKYLDQDDIIIKADKSLQVTPMHITDISCEHSEGSKNDFYSNGDYWWPNPETADGKPYVRRDGQSNPNNFHAHRLILQDMKTHVGNLTLAYKLTQDKKYAKKAIVLLKEFFLDSETRMSPHLLYGQAIPGVCSGRYIGIIDTVHLVDIPFCIEVLKDSTYMEMSVYEGLQEWFKDYLHWMRTHPYGIEEMQTTNNHSVCYFVQVAAFAHFVGDREAIDFCIKSYKEILLPNQMGIDGSFKEELARTKPYGYSYFILDNMITLCQVLSKYQPDIWNFITDDGKCIKKGLDFFVPYIEDISNWPYPKDIQYFDQWPVAMSMLLFAGIAFDETGYLKLYKEGNRNPKEQEMIRFMNVKQPMLWL